jgi:hypothetical protein
MPLAAEIAADKSGHLSAAAQTHRGQAARQEFVERSSAVEEGRGRAIRNRVGIAVRDNQYVARRDSDVLLTREAHYRFSIGDQVIADQSFGPRGKHMGNLLQVRHLESPRGAALRVIEDCAGHAHRRQGLR